MYYAVTHLTIYKYSEPITDSVMELRMHPRSDSLQSCLRFDLNISPKAKAFPHTDYLGNIIHTFDIPGPHERLAIKSEAVVDMKPAHDLPQSLPESTWQTIDTQSNQRDYYDMVLPGHYTKETDLLRQFAQEIGWKRRDDPLSLLRELNTIIFEHFDYEQHVTKVDSPIDTALAARQGVCQDFAHIMIALGRKIGIPCRYVSGYLYHRNDRSDEDASHAWMEAWLPELGWVGFDPTNNLIAGERHIRVSLGMDYADAAPTRGVFKGAAETQLEVRVQVSELDQLPVEYAELTPEIAMPQFGYQTQQQQQQQQ